MCFRTLCGRLGAVLRPRRRQAGLYLGDAPEQPTTALGPGELELLTERESRGGRAAAAWLWSAGSSGVWACQRAGAGGEEQAHGTSLPRLNCGARLPAAHGARAWPDLRRGRELPRSPAGQEGFASARQAKLECVGTGVPFPSSRPGLPPTDKVTVLFYFIYLPVLKQPASEAF